MASDGTFARPEPGREAPTGFHFEAVEQGDEWATELQSEYLCRYTVGPGHKTCRRRAVVKLRRRGRWWRYCELHLYGRWIEGTKVMGWRLVKDGGE